MNKTEEEIQNEHAHRNSNGLTPAEQERLVKLSEECGESVQAICKAINFGYLPHDARGNLMFNNKHEIEKEIGDILAITQLLVDCGDLDIKEILKQKVYKRTVIKGRLLHQDPDPIGTEYNESWIISKPKSNEV